MIYHCPLLVGSRNGFESDCQKYFKCLLNNRTKTFQLTCQFDHLDPKDICNSLTLPIRLYPVQVVEGRITIH